jgi:trimethyllysine dioxygenase
LKPIVHSPVFSHDSNGTLIQIRWNADDRAPVGGKEWEGKMEEWFEAVRVWEEILRSKEASLWTKMEMGTAVSMLIPTGVLNGRSRKSDRFIDLF